MPDPVKDYTFTVDSVVQEGDRIDLGRGIVWQVYETPGHSPCHISLLERKNPCGGRRDRVLPPEKRYALA